LISNSEDVELEHCTASYSSAGVSSYSSEIDIPSSYLWENNNGVQSYNGNDMSVSYTYFCGTALDLKAYNFSSIYTYACYFDGGTPSISKSSECTVQTSSNLSCGSYKISSSRQGENENYQFALENDSTSGSGFEQINSEYFSLNRKRINALKTKTTLNQEVLCNEYEKVIEDYKNFIAENPDSPLARKAVIYITRCLRRIDNLREDRKATGMRNFLTGIIENKKYPALKSSAERLMIDYYTEVKDYTSAIEISNSLIEKYKSDNYYACDVLYEKGLILLNNLKNSAEAAKCFITILQDYPESPIANLAENHLIQLGYNKDEFESEKDSSSLAKEYNISNSPNPFNPVTTIQYNLPEDINVVLEVFNIRGQKVKTLVNNFQSAGSHEVIFDGSNLGSGVYFYRFKAGNFNKVKRMLLVK
jgi:tetratricopeptide (TPR) repeat protein